MTPTQAQVDALIEVVRQAGAREIMPRFRNLAGDEVAAKSSAMDLVTVADRAAEDAIRRDVGRILRGAAVVGEEAAAADPHLLGAIATAETCVIVDPIDGTGNYVAGLGLFGTILAVTHRGRTVFGLLYDPVADDWMYALRGEGAWFRRRDGSLDRIRTCGDRDLADATGFVAMDDRDAGRRERIARGFGGVFHIRDIRCSCHEYRALASGHVDFLRSQALKPWDHAAGVLLTEEAGGWAAVDGDAPYVPARHDGRIVAASCEAMGRRVASLSAGLP